MPLSPTEYLSIASAVVSIAREVTALAKDWGAGSGGRRASPINRDVEDAALATAAEWLAAAQKVAPDPSRYLLPDAAELRSIGDLELSLQRARVRQPDRRELLQAIKHLPVVHHSRVEVTPDGGIALFLGQTPATASLKGAKLSLVNRGYTTMVPTFKITMLGNTNAGKTTYMSAMYTRLVEGVGNVALRAVDNAIDLELRQHMELMLLDSDWPEGTRQDLRKYDFHLMSRGRRIADVDWVDYRGGDAKAGNEHGERLVQRIRESHAILWMVDMTRVPATTDIASQKARILTDVSRYAGICRTAMIDNTEPKAWVFVRTKSDKVRAQDGRVDWDRASKELILHMGDATNVVQMGAFSRGSVAPVSVCGSVNAQGKPDGDGAVHAEWPLFLAMSGLMTGEMLRIRGRINNANDELVEARRGGFTRFVRDFLDLGPTEAELTALSQRRVLQHQLLSVYRDMQEIMRNCPACVQSLG